MNGGSGRHQGGVTLIEAVVAVALTAVVVLLSAAVMLSVRRALAARPSSRAWLAADAALRAWGGDVESAFAPEGETSLRLEAKAADTGQPRLQLVRWGEPDAEGEAGPSEEIVWRVAGQDRGETVWERIRRVRVGPGADSAPVTTRLVRGLVAVRIEATDGTNWWADWPPALDEARREAPMLPAGMRVTLVPARGQPQEALAAIRAAIEVLPRIERRAEVKRDR
ncbi:MAG: prepilin-type N-terminal cleavage/methylation domain-containing protein [Kiritimatiellae bacterium]|nr:prepilin-type N-terminal cleavage/methylation domain-containing protein [Kiritimatiellia bacterium]